MFKDITYLEINFNILSLYKYNFFYHTLQFLDFKNRRMSNLRNADANSFQTMIAMSAFQIDVNFLLNLTGKYINGNGKYAIIQTTTSDKQSG